LPLVEFEVDPSIEEDEVEKLIAEAPAGGPGQGGGGGRRDEYGDGGGYGGQDGRDDSSGDLFSRQLMTGEVLEKGIPVKIDRRVLASLEPREVFTLHWNKGKMGMRPRRFKSVVPEIPIVLCTNCNHFFHEEDFEFASLQKKECPFCKLEINEDFGKQHKLAKVKAAVQSVMAQRQRQSNMLGAVTDAVRR